MLGSIITIVPALPRCVGTAKPNGRQGTAPSDRVKLIQRDVGMRKMVGFSQVTNFAVLLSDIHMEYALPTATFPAFASFRDWSSH